ncbi:MAG: glutamine-hydrolyzing GMP synthase [Neisseriaceae bacterium]
MDNAILILDFGSQLSQLIARRIRELQVYCELHPFDWPLDKIRQFKPRGIILSGGPESVQTGKYQADPRIFELGIPILGICYGMQWMVQVLGGTVLAADKREFGHAKVQVLDSPLTEGISDYPQEKALEVWMSHGDQVVTLPSEFSQIGWSENCNYAIVANEEKGYYGVQFHPEVTHTRSGTSLLKKFVYEICCIQPDWTMSHYVEEMVEQIRRQVGTDKVILALSGGVDSSVAAVLIHKAIGEQLSCIFVDHGLLRLNEAQQVMEQLHEHLGVQVTAINAEKRFMAALAGVTDPEQKRRIIGAQFIEVFQEEAHKNVEVRWLAQGTIYPDVIESAGGTTKKAHAIKSHHNVGGLPEKLQLQLLEPLRNLFKDEVRKLGIELGLPRTLVYRHPFPGPGLGVRILGEIRSEYAELLRLADHIFIEELRQSYDEQGCSWYDKTAQAFAVFLPVRSVGVMGDARTYEYVVALRAVVTNDFMTAHTAELPYALLTRVSSRIINEVPGINRVVYDFSSKPPATIEWE